MNSDVVQLAYDFVKSKNKGRNRKVTPYNVFTAWKMNENDHTKLLLSLLRYKDAYGQYPVLHDFLYRFAQRKKIYYNNPEKIEIQFSPCYPNDDKRSLIDGLITIEVNQNKRFAVIIENKIFDAADQKGQIRRYITRMKDDEGIQIENIWVFYITGDGTKEVDPTSYNYEEEDEATNIGQRFIPLAYSRDIMEWLKEDILDARIYPESLTGIVRAYVEYLEEELFSTNKNQNWEQDLKLISKLGGLNVSNPIIKKENLNQLYCLFDKVKDSRQKLLKEDSAKEQDVNDIEFLYQSLRYACIKVEEKAFHQFEKVSIDILNEHWKKELKKKGLTWKAKHRGLRGKNGFIQISLTDEWGTAHLEWTSINPERLLWSTEYTVEVHVEGNKPLAIQWKQILESDCLLLPPQHKLCSTSRIFKYTLTTGKPIAKMKGKELMAFLTKLYTQDLNYLCRLLVENS